MQVLMRDIPHDEMWITGQKFVERDAEGIDVVAAVELPPFQLLGAHIEECAG